MSSLFKCLIEINEQKYRIIINNNINDIKLSDVLSEIQKIDSKLNILFETHLFEVIIYYFYYYLLFIYIFTQLFLNRYLTPISMKT